MNQVMKFLGAGALWSWIALGALAFPALAQTGTISGTVLDGSGSAVPDVAVNVTNEATGASAETVSNAAGQYEISGLAPGNYKIDAAKEGFDSLAKEHVAVTADQVAATDLTLTAQPMQPVYEEVTVTARRVEEEAQDVPIPVSVVSGELVEKAGAFNVNRLKELVPTVQFYSSNPRNSAITIRGLGSPFGLTNDGIEPGVGLYVDGVFHARPAAATADFLDLERIEVLRGPQGTLFGKNTTAGAISITTRRPTFTPEANFEVSFGNYGYIQAKGSLSGPLTSKLAGRLSFSGTQRDGTVYNIHTQDDVNDLNNQGIRGQLMFVASDKVTITGSVDYTRQRAEGYTQVIAGVAPTLRNANRQYAQIASDLHYTAPSFNAFDRVTDVDSPLRSYQDLGGGAVTVEWNVGPGQLTSISAWRYWDWNPSNDRDFIGLPVTTVSAAPSKQRQWTQEIRYAGYLNPRLSFVSGVFLYHQDINSDPASKQEQGSAAWRFLLAPTAAAATPGLLDGYGFNQVFDYNNSSAAGFGQLEWQVTNRFRIIPGIRVNYDHKDVDFDQQVYGGLQTTDPALIALQRSVLAPQKYAADVGDGNVSGQLTLAYKTGENTNFYGTYATGFKSVGLNLGGVPTDALDQPILSAAVVRPENVDHFEVGIKSRPFRRVTANFAAFNTKVKDLQTQVVNAQVGVLRGYLANAEEARVRGLEFDGDARFGGLSLYTALAFTDGRYISFPDAPPPLEDTGGPQFKDVSGSVLPGISKWAGSMGGEYKKRGRFLGLGGEFFARLDASFRSDFSTSPSASRYLIADSYQLLNARIGFRSADGWAFSIWGRNLANANYFELMSPAPGNSGLYVGQPGDPRTFGVTLSRTFGGPADPHKAAPVIPAVSSHELQN